MHDVVRDDLVRWARETSCRPTSGSSTDHLYIDEASLYGRVGTLDKYPAAPRSGRLGPDDRDGLAFFGRAS